MAPHVMVPSVWSSRRDCRILRTVATPAPAEPPSPAGETPERIGPYRIVGSLATGGMAEIFLGRKLGAEGFARSVVIKRILPHLARDEGFVNMFLDEARITAGLRHPNVVSVEELQRDGDDLYMVMEYLAGESASALLRALVKEGRPLAPELAAYIVAEACAGLHAAHTLKDEAGVELGVVHRDVSPQNVVVTYDGSVKVLDFGIAQARQRLTKTETGMLKGKFDYMSPEQIQNEPLDRRSDVFALGVVLYEMLTARRLFRRGNPGATLSAVLSHRIAPPSELAPGVDPALDAVCLRALSRQRRTRYQSALDMRRELLAALPREDGRLPEERLRALMHELFAERVTAKQEMLRRVGAGDEAVEIIREAESGSADMRAVQTAPSRIAPPLGQRPPRRSWPLVVGAIAVALVAGVGVAIFAWPEPAPPPTVAASEAPPPTTVAIDVVSSPPGATARLPSGETWTTPASLELPISSEPVVVTFELEGHEPVRERITPDVDQRLRVQLRPLPEPAVEEEEPAAEQERAPTPRPRPRRPRPPTQPEIELWD